MSRWASQEITFQPPRAEKPKVCRFCGVFGISTAHRSECPSTPLGARILSRQMEMKRG